MRLSTEDPGVQSGNVVGVRQMIRVYRVGMWWGESRQIRVFRTEWECGGGEVDDPGVQSGNVVG